MSKQNLRYRVGIDVGLFSVGLCAVEIDDSNDDPRDAIPIRLLSCMSVIHDGGVDPDYAKSADSRKAISGVARRTRRMRKREHARLEALDACLEKMGYPVDRAKAIAEGLDNLDDQIGKGYPAWNARIYAAEQFIDNDQERKLAVAVALRHIARHRGWRNPYSGVSAIGEMSRTASSFYQEFFDRVELWKHDVGMPLDCGATAVFNTDEKKGDSWVIEVPDSVWSDPERPTPAQLIKEFLDPGLAVRFRRDYPEGYEGLVTQIGKLHQSDYYQEIQQIFATQKVPDEQRKELLDIVFQQVNPKDVGAAASLVAKDDLPGQGRFPRASKASPAFQRYRILTTITNLRINDGKAKNRPLSVEEIQDVYAFLTTKATDETTWHDVADVLGIERSQLRGVGGTTQDGNPISAKRPPIMNTDLDIKNYKKKIPALFDWWRAASDSEKEFLVEFLGNAGISESNLGNEELMAKSEVDAFLGSLTDEELQNLEGLRITAGRAAYSVDSLNRLNKRMLEYGEDLHTARKAEFGIEDDWHPAPTPLGTPTGNPATDRTIRIVSRWLKACEKRWGKPETINIEHVREGFKSPKNARKEQAEMNSRHKANLEIREEIIESLGDSNGYSERGVDAIRHADIRRYQAVQRQNCQCAYCGKKIDFYTAQMDHIVPRKGPGCSNDLPNLIAVCASCNKSKKNTLFYRWAGTDEKRQEVLDRVDTWNRDSYFSNEKQFKSYLRDVKARLMQKEEDEPLDARSIESVAWMARELREQIEGFFGYQGVVISSTDGNADFGMNRVNVYRGSLTAEARKASGIEKTLPWVGGASAKTRLDRRHHAVDAAIIALMRPAVGKVLSEREALRREAIESNISHKELIEQYGRRSWKEYEGIGNDSDIYQLWRDTQMKRLGDLLAKAMVDDNIVVTNPVRLSLGNGRAHEDTIYPMYKVRVGDALTPVNIDKAESPALWCALTGHPDFDPIKGLPEDPNRQIRVNGRWLTADDEIGFFVVKPSGRCDETAMKAEFDTVKNAVYTSVRNGFAAIGNSIHHARFYRIPKLNSKGKQTGSQYAYLRVFQADLLKYRDEDLFSVDIPPQSVSRRSAVPSLRRALDEGTAEYLGWVAVGDEVQINPEHKYFSPDANGAAINKFMMAFPSTTRFKIIGFPTRDQIKLAPLILAAEGVPTEGVVSEEETKSIYGDHGWSEKDIMSINTILGIHGSFHPSVDALLSTSPVFIRRNALGEIRWKSSNHMPISWKVPPHPEIG